VVQVLGRPWVPVVLGALLLAFVMLPFGAGRWSPELERRALGEVALDGGVVARLYNGAEGGGSATSDAALVVTEEGPGGASPREVFRAAATPQARLAVGCWQGACVARLYRGQGVVPSAAWRVFREYLGTVSPGASGSRAGIEPIAPRLDLGAVHARLRTESQAMWVLYFFTFLAAMGLGGRQPVVAAFMAVPLVATAPFLLALQAEGLALGFGVVSSLIAVFAALGAWCGLTMPRRPRAGSPANAGPAAAAKASTGDAP